MIQYWDEVCLDTLDTEDLWQLRKWRNDPEIWRWTRQNDLISESQHQEWFSRQGKDPTIQMYAVRNAHRTLLGACGLTSLDRTNRRAEFSLYIAPKWQGKRFGKIALQTLIRHGFKNLGLHLIWGETFAGNPALRMFMDIGFRFEGIRRDFYFRDGQFINAILISMKESECSFLATP